MKWLTWKKFRFLLILITAIYLNFWIFPNVTINSEELTKIEIENTTYLQIPDTISKKDISAGNVAEVIWKILYFSSKSDRVCFENFGTYIDYENKIDSENIEVGINYNGEKFEVKDKVCKKFEEDMDKFTFNWYFDSRLIVSSEIIKQGGQFLIRPRVKTYLVKNS